MKAIELTLGLSTLVDDADYEPLAQHKWRAMRTKRNVYAVRAVGTRVTQHCVLMHRVILDAPEGFHVDHRDGNGLNNQRENIRVATHSQNLSSSRIARGESRFRGVSRNGESRKPWVARVRIEGRSVYLGRFSSEEEAARLYDQTVRELRGEFAVVNFPMPGELGVDIWLGRPGAP